MRREQSGSIRTGYAEITNRAVALRFPAHRGPASALLLAPADVINSYTLQERQYCTLSLPPLVRTSSVSRPSAWVVSGLLLLYLRPSIDLCNFNSRPFLFHAFSLFPLIPSFFFSYFTYFSYSYSPFLLFFLRCAVFSLFLFASGFF